MERKLFSYNVEPSGWRHVVVGLFVSLSLFSCKKFLDADLPKSKLQNEQVFESDITAKQAILSMYSAMVTERNFACGDPTSITALAGLSADELVNYPRTDASLPEFDENDLSALNLAVLDLWTSLYKTTYLANSCIEGLTNANNLTPAIKNALLGESLFTRAFCHFYLVNLFGDVPLITTTDAKVNASVGRTPVAEVYLQIVKDLQEAKPLLNAGYGVEGRIRVNRATASALLARTFLYLQKWSEAEQEATVVITDANYSLVDISQVFLANSREAIWQLRPGQGVSTNPDEFYTLEAYSFLPPQVLGANVLAPGFQTIFESGDKRFTQWVGKQGAIYFPYKYRNNSLSNPTKEYSMVFRLAEQYLIRAEARLHLGELIGASSAQSDLDTVRSRASLPGTTASSASEFALAIEQERRVELFTEWGHRWLDLKRTNRADAVLDPIKPRWTSIDALYPLPQKERNNNPNLTPQNPGY